MRAQRLAGAGARAPLAANVRRQFVAVEQTNVVDAAGIDKETDELVLTLLDSMSWHSEVEHLSLLQTKINRYLDFLDSAQLVEQYPDAKFRSVRIDLYFKYNPPLSAVGFLTKAQQTVEKLGHGFTWRVHDA